VCVVANLKPAKLAGEPSQAMVLAASCSSTAAADGSETEIVRPLVPPGGSLSPEW
jgi:aminoacyl tRNA synthase complex-interacting multifunctional protein 1